jgi:hypothetical protein
MRSLRDAHSLRFGNIPLPTPCLDEVTLGELPRVSRRSTKILSMQRPLPSMLIVTAWFCSVPVKSSLVNWLP